MTRINTNLQSLSTIQNLTRVNQQLSEVMARLSSGRQINKAADNPAGLIISEQLRAQMEEFAVRIDSAERTANALTTADDALGGISEILISVRGNAVAMANDAALPEEARQALQGQIDNSLDAINRIASSADFGGQPLLQGGFTAALGDVEITLGMANTSSIGGEGEGESLSTIGSGGINEVFENIAAAVDVIDQAIADITQRRGEIGAFVSQQLAPAIEQFAVALENLTSANSAIADADFAVEIANLLQAQLQQNATISVAAAANTTTESVLRLLGG